MSPDHPNVPSGWVATTLGEVAQIEAGQSPPSSSFTDDPSAVAFLQGNAEFGELFPSPVKRTSAPTKFASEEAVLLSVRAPVGATNLAPSRLAIGRGLMAVEPLGGMDRRFLLWLLRYKRPELERQATGTTFSAVTGAVVRSLPVLLPPLAEQARIVETVERVLGRIADGDAHVRRAIQGCAEFEAAVLGELFGANYPRRRLDEVGDVFLGFTPSRKLPELWDGDVPWVSSGEVAFCRIASTRETVSEAALGNRSRRLNPPGTVLLAMYGEGKTRGQAAILDIEAATNQAVAAVRLREDVMAPEFLYYCLMAQYATIRQVGQGGQQINLNGDLVRAIEVPAPPIDVQRRLIADVDRRLAEGQRLHRTLEHGLEASGRLLASLLHAAFSGDLAARSSTAAPGQELLHAIARERAQRPSRQRRERNPARAVLVEE